MADWTFRYDAYASSCWRAYRDKQINDDDIKCDKAAVDRYNTAGQRRQAHTISASWRTQSSAASSSNQSETIIVTPSASSMLIKSHVNLAYSTVGIHTNLIV